MKNVSAGDIFEIDTSGVYSCVVLQYHVGHGEMLVKVFSIAETTLIDLFYFVFSGVVYFEGPLKWENKRFYIGEKDECIGLLSKIGITYAVDAVNTGYFHLFKTGLSDFEIKIVAQHVLKIDKGSPMYPNLVN